MHGLLVRVGIDSSTAYGGWNAPYQYVQNQHRFAYVPIFEDPHRYPQDAGYKTSFRDLANNFAEAVEQFGVHLPNRLVEAQNHLDPDYRNLTYGDANQRAKRIRELLCPGDFIAFYSGLRDVDNKNGRLVYALTGFYVVKKIVFAHSVPQNKRDHNAHTRYDDYQNEERNDIVVFADKEKSGRLKYCIPIGEHRNGMYRVTEEMLQKWGGLSVRDGFIQRNVYLPEFTDPTRFLKWFFKNKHEFIHQNIYNYSKGSVL